MQKELEQNFATLKRGEKEIDTEYIEGVVKIN